LKIDLIFQDDLICNNEKQKGSNEDVKGETEVMVQIDVCKMSQVLRNLLSNALKFSPAGSQVVVSLSLHHGNSNNNQQQHHDKAKADKSNKAECVRLCVTDTGAGISAENQKRLFHEIIQFDAAKLQQGKGSGIGLWISKKIVALHEGSIGVYSKGLHQGSTFYVDIPIVEKRRKNKMSSTIPLESPIVVVEEGSNKMGKEMMNHAEDAEEIADPTEATKEEMKEEASVFTIQPSSLPPLPQKSSSPKSIFKESVSQLKRVPAKTSAEPSTEWLSALSPTSRNNNQHTHEPSPAATPKKKSYRLLIVDDSPVNRKMMKRLLQEVFEVIDEAMHGLDCLQKLHMMSTVNGKDNSKDNVDGDKDDNRAKVAYDMIIMDYWMPEMNGLETVQVLRAKGYGGKIVGLTGNTEKTMNDQFRAAGVDLVLTKPYQGIDLVELFQGKQLWAIIMVIVLVVSFVLKIVKLL